jgi:hypothetical protein
MLYLTLETIRGKQRGKIQGISIESEFLTRPFKAQETMQKYTSTIILICIAQEIINRIKRQSTQ